MAEYFRNFGVTTRFDGGDAVLGYDRSLLAGDLQLDLSDCPDLAQTIVVTACLLGVKFRISGLRTLRIKETDRFLALQTELDKLGYRLHAASGDRDALQWDGAKGDYVACPQIATYKDHRMAMAFAYGICSGGSAVSGFGYRGCRGGEQVVSGILGRFT